MSDHTNDPDRNLLDTSNTPREVRTGMGRKRGGGTEPDDEIDVGRLESEGSDTGTEAGVGLERGGMGSRGEGYTARRGSERGGELEEEDLDDDGDEDEDEDPESEEDNDLGLEDDFDTDDDEDEEDELV